MALPRSFIAKVKGNIWELRPEASGTEFRFLYFALVGQQFVVLHAITKKTQKLRPRDIELAEERMAEVKRRIVHEGASPIRSRKD